MCLISFFTFLKFQYNEDSSSSDFSLFSCAGSTHTYGTVIVAMSRVNGVLNLKNKAVFIGMLK